jgi:hypothetical protein
MFTQLSIVALLLAVLSVTAKIAPGHGNFTLVWFYNFHPTWRILRDSVPDVKSDATFKSQFNNLVWSDEFTNGISGDWDFDIGGGGWGNNELEYYRRENAYQENGVLVIAARREDYGGLNPKNIYFSELPNLKWNLILRLSIHFCSLEDSRPKKFPLWSYGGTNQRPHLFWFMACFLVRETNKNPLNEFSLFSTMQDVGRQHQLGRMAVLWRDRHHGDSQPREQGIRHCSLVRQQWQPCSVWKFHLQW